MQRKYLKIMRSIVPMGAVGASLLLGSTLPTVAAERPAFNKSPVSARLSAIREAVLVVVGPGEVSKLDNNNFHLTWGNRWNNWGWGGRRWGWGGRPRWNNWRNGWPNWNNFWRNW
jgi:hypothetical protein